MDLRGQSKILYSYDSAAGEDWTTVVLTDASDAVLGEIKLESAKLRSFFAGLSSIFEERSKALQTPKSSEVIMKVLHRVQAGEGEIGYSP